MKLLHVCWCLLLVATAFCLGCGSSGEKGINSGKDKPKAAGEGAPAPEHGKP
jgi:hypothetical protein